MLIYNCKYKLYLKMNSLFAPIEKLPRSDSPPAKIPLFTKNSFVSGFGSEVSSISSTNVNSYNCGIKRPSDDESINPLSKRCCY